MLDMDGTFYLGDRLLPGALEFLSLLHTNHIDYLFLTNNSSKSKQEYAAKLRQLGAAVSEDKIFTSGEATAWYLLNDQRAFRVFLVGTPALEDEFKRHGLILTDDHPDVAVLGFDTTLTYSKIAQLSGFLVRGIPYIATHPDVNCPTETGFIPDIGAMIEMMAASTGRRPDVIIGKPNQPIVDAIAKKLTLPVEALAMIGDRLYTDIAMGASGIHTVLVLSGETTVEQLEGSPIQPDLVVNDLSALVKALVDHGFNPPA